MSAALIRSAVWLSSTLQVSLLIIYFETLTCPQTVFKNKPETPLQRCVFASCDLRSNTFKSCNIDNVDWGLGGKDACDLSGVSFLGTSVDAAVADATLVMHYPALPSAATY